MPERAAAQNVASLADYALAAASSRRMLSPPVERGTPADFQRTLRAHTSAALARSHFMHRFGTAYGGLRDFYKAFGYARELTFDDFKFRYERDGIAGRIVDLPAQDTWRNFPDVEDAPEEGGDESDESPFEKAWSELSERLRLREAFERLDRMAGIGHYGVLLLGVKGVSLEQALPDAFAAEDVIFAAPYDEGSARISKLVESTSNPRFGMPETYTVQLAAPALTPGSVGTSMLHDTTALLPARSNVRKVHWSHVLHFAENALGNRLIGIPRLLRPWNILDDLQKLGGGSAETFWLSANRGMQFDVDKDLDLSPEDKADLLEQFEEYEHLLRRQFRTRGVSINELGSSVANPRGIFSVTMALLIGATGIPLRMLFGTERGQIATVQDRTTWLEQIQVRQRVVAEPQLVRPLIDLLVQHGAMPKPARPDYRVKWPDLLASSDKDRAEIAHMFARAAADFARQKALGAVIVDENEVRTRYFGFGRRSDSQQAKIDAELKELAARQKNPGPQDAGARSADKTKGGAQQGDGGGKQTNARPPRSQA